MQTILFVCTGNTCRSPMAEAIARHLVGTGDFGPPSELLVASAGVCASDGSPTTRETIEALRTLGIEHDGRSKPVNAEMVRKADAVFCMTSSHKSTLLELTHASPDDLPYVMLLDPDGDISDPIGAGQAAYDELAGHLLELIPRRLKEVLSDEDRARIGSSG